MYQTLPEQGNNATIVSLLPLFHFSYTDSPPGSTRYTYVVLTTPYRTQPQSTYTPNTMSYNYTTSSSDAPYDPPRPGASAFSGPSPYEKYDTNTAVAHAAQGQGEAASYYNNSYNSLPELKYDYRGGEGASSKVSLPQAEVPAYQPPSYPPTNSH